MKDQLDVTGLGDRMIGLCSKECGKLLGAGKDKETDFPLQLPERNAPC